MNDTEQNIPERFLVIMGQPGFMAEQTWGFDSRAEAIAHAKQLKDEWLEENTPGNDRIQVKGNIRRDLAYRVEFPDNPNRIGWYIEIEERQ